MTIGIAGVTAPPTPEDRQAWRAPPGSTLAIRPRRCGTRRRRCAPAAPQLVVALVHVGERADVRKLLDAAPGVDWAVVGHGNMRFDTPEEAGGARLLQGLGNGKELGRLDLHVVGGGVRFADGGASGRSSRPSSRTTGGSSPTTIGGSRRPIRSRVRDFFVSRRAAMQKAIATEEALLARLPTAVSGSWFENRLLPLDAATPDQTGVALLVDAYNRESVRRAAAGKPVGLVTDSARPGGRRRRGRGRRAGEPGRSRREGGAAPRLPRRRRLRDVPRAGARVLEDDGSTPERSPRWRASGAIGYPACVGCHVTGYLRDGGTRDIAEARQRLANVGCEACHGPGQAHVEAAPAAKRSSTARAVPEPVCRGCHTADQTNGEFDYRAFVAAVLGPGHGAPPAP